MCVFHEFSCVIGLAEDSLIMVAWIFLCSEQRLMFRSLSKIFKLNELQAYVTTMAILQV